MFKVEMKGLEKAMEAVSPQTLQKATTSALNKLVSQVRTAAVKKVTDKWNIKRSDLTTTGTGKARLEIKRATWGNQTATLTITGRSVSLSYFGAIQLNRGATIAGKIGKFDKSNANKKTGSMITKAQKTGLQGIAVQILKGGKTTMLPSAFFARVNAGYHGFHIGAFNRKGKARLPIAEKRLISIPSMFNQAPVMAEVQRVIDEKWSYIFVHELNFYLDKAGK